MVGDKVRASGRPLLSGYISSRNQRCSSDKPNPQVDHLHLWSNAFRGCGHPDDASEWLWTGVPQKSVPQLLVATPLTDRAQPLRREASGRKASTLRERSARVKHFARREEKSKPHWTMFCEQEALCPQPSQGCVFPCQKHQKGVVRAATKYSAATVSPKGFDSLGCLCHTQVRRNFFRR